MPFNTDDYTKPPFIGGIMTLTNDETIKVKEGCQKAIDEFVPDRYTPVFDDIYVVSSYNQSTDYKELINGDTYHTAMQYDAEINTQGINENGIVPELEVEEQPEEPTEEPTETPEEPTEGETSPDEENVPTEPETAPAETTEETTEEA